MLTRTLEPEIMDRPDRAEAYAAADFAAVNEAFVARFVEQCAGAIHGVVADLGPGPCDIPYRVAADHPHARILCVEASPAMIDLARADDRFRPAWAQVQLLRADAKVLPMAPRSVDAIMSNSILHHLPDPAPFWREIARVLKPGGVLFLRDLMRPPSTQHVHALVEEHAGAESPLLREEFHNSLLAAFTPEEVRAQLGAAGLATLSVAPVSDRHLDVYGTLP